MGLLRILAIATIAEICVALALLAALGAGGAVWPWLDLINCVAPLLVPLGAAAGGVAWKVLPPARARPVCVGLALAASAYGTAMTLPNVFQPMAAPTVPAGAPKLRLVTANVFHDNPSPFSAARTLIRRNADVLIVVEGDGTLERVRPILAAAYPQVTRCDANGVQIWLRTPILSEGCSLFNPPEWHPNWGQAFVWVKTLGPDGEPIVVAATHLARPYPPLRQTLERGGLPTKLAALGPDRLILAGDFNTVPWTFGMRRLDRAAAPLHRLTHWLATYPAQINLTMTPVGWGFLPIDHFYSGAAWSRVQLTRFRIPNSDHFALELEASVGRPRDGSPDMRLLKLKTSAPSPHSATWRRVR